jgi:hypothetical protein
MPYPNSPPMDLQLGDQRLSGEGSTEGRVARVIELVFGLGHDFRMTGTGLSMDARGDLMVDEQFLESKFQ